MATNTHKYFAEVSFKNTDIFNPSSIDTWEEWRKELFLKLDFNQDVLDHISNKRLDFIKLDRKFN